MDRLTTDTPFAVNVDDVLITHELQTRPSREPDYAGESRALSELADELATNPDGVLQKLVDLVIDLCHADSAGVSILEPGGERGIFRWHAIAGAFAPYVHGTLPRDASPCGTVIARDQVLLFNDPERFFPNPRGVEPRTYENLLAPWHVNGQPVGTVWAVAHTPERHFDAENARLLESLSRFAAAAWQTIAALQEAEAGRRELGQRVEERTATLEAANSALRMSEERLQRILETETVGILIFDASGTILQTNDAFLEMTGYTQEQVERRELTWQQMTPSEWVAESERQLAKLAATGRIGPYEKQYILADGSLCWMLFAGRDLGDGTIAEYCIDISERKQVEEALRVSEERLRSLFDTMSQGVAILELVRDDAGAVVDTRYLELNPAFETLIGLDRSTVVGRMTSEVFPEYSLSWSSRLESVDGTAAPQHFEHFVPETGRWFSFYAAPFGDPDRFVTFFDDITERKAAELAIQTTERRTRFQTAAFQAVIDNASLADTLEILARLVAEETGGQARTAFYLIDPDGRELHPIWGAGDMDEAYLREVDGFPVNAESLCSGLAIATGQPSVPRDVFDEPKWQSLLHLATAHGFRAAWSFPIRTRGGNTVGALAMYFRDPREATPEDLALAEVVSQSAGVIIASHTETQERVHAEAALRESEAKYRALFESMDEAYAVVEVLADETGAWSDFLFLEVNPAFVKHTNMEYPVGRRATDLLGTPNPNWVQLYGQVAETGEPIRVEEREPTLDRIFDLFIFRLGGEGSRRVAVLFTDITERRHVDATLRESEERQAFLVRLSDTLRPLADPRPIQAAATALLREQFDAGWCYYVEFDEAGTIGVVLQDATRAGLPSLAGSHDVSDVPEYLDLLRSGRIVHVPDFADFELLSPPIRERYTSLGVHSILGAPLLKEGAPLAILLLADTEERHWPESAVALIHETAERTWAAVERARTEVVLRKSEEQYRTLFETMDEGFALCELVRDADGGVVDYRYLDLNLALVRHGGITPDDLKGRRATEVFPNLDPWLIETYERVVDAGESVLVEHYFPHVDRWLRINAYPRGSDRFAVLYSDVTARVRAEEALRTSEERKTFLLSLSDALRPLSDPVAIQGETCRLVGEHFATDRAYYATIDDARDLGIIERDYVRGHAPSLVGEHPLAMFGAILEPLRKGEPYVCDDVLVDPRVSDEERTAYLERALVSVLTVPLIKDGAHVGAMALTNGTPRRWTPDEITLLQEVAERTWETVERARAEAALRKSELRLQLAVESARVGTFIWYAAEDRDEPDAQTLALFGVPPGGRLTLAAALATMIHPDDRVWFADAMTRAIEPGGTGSVREDIRVVHPDGSLHWLALTAQNVSHILPSTGAVMAGVVLDITERKHYEAALRESEERFRLIVDGARDYAIITTDLDGRIESWSPGAEAVFGWTQEEVIGQPIALIFTPDDQDNRVPENERVTALREGFARDVRWHQRKDGTRVFIDGATRLLEHGDGETVGLLKLGQDITQRQQTEADLRESEERFRTVANLVPDLLWQSAPDGSSDWYNDRWYEYTGQAPEEAVGWGWTDAIHPEDRAQSTARYAEATANGQPLQQEHRIRAADGTYRWFLVRAESQNDASGTITRSIGAATDIHVQRMAQEELATRVAAATAELRALSRQLLQIQEQERRFLANELHDEIGQALTGLNFTLAMARRSDASEHLERAVEISQDLLEQVRQLSLDLRPSVLDDMGLIPALTALAERMRQRTGARIEIRHQGVDRRFPQEIETTAYRVVQEALTNIMRHAQTDQASVHLLIDSTIALWVSDAGKGFDLDAVRRAGTSIGLTGMAERVRLVGGTFQIESAPGEGTTIVVELPLDLSPSAPDGGP